jgi:hypothetical protein
MCWGGGEQQQQQYQEPIIYYYPSPAAPETGSMISDVGGGAGAGQGAAPYQSFTGTGYGATEALLGGQLTPQMTGSGMVPTGGWGTSGNANVIPGAAQQLLRTKKSPQYTWG